MSSRVRARTPGEGIAAASDTFHLTIGPECDARTWRKAGGRGWTGRRAPKNAPAESGKPIAIPHLAGKGWESFLEEPQGNRYIQDAGLVGAFSLLLCVTEFRSLTGTHGENARAPGRKFPLEGMALR